MSGRGGGGRGGRGGWRGRGRGPMMGPVAKDDEGNVLDTNPAGPPVQFPEVLLPEQPGSDISDKDRVLLLMREDLDRALKKSPFFLESKVEKSVDVETAIEQFTALGTPGVAGSVARAPSAKRKLAREPLTSVVKLLPEYFPEELFTSSDRKHARLQDTYWKRNAARKDDTGLGRLSELAAREERGEGAEGGEGDDDGAGEAEQEPIDTDDEEDMDQDDYYQGAYVDDDEGYEDGFDDGGNDEPVF